MSNTESEAKIQLRIRFLLQYEQFVREHQGDTEAIKKWVRKWRPSKTERSSAGGELRKWKKSVLKHYHLYIDNEETMDVLLGKNVIQRRKRDSHGNYHERDTHYLRSHDIQVLLGKSDIPCFLNWAHENKHFGKTQMFQRLNGVHWNGIDKDIACWISMCPVCEETQPNNIVAPLKAIVSMHKRQRVEIDLFDVGERNRDPITSYRYVLVIVDCFSKRVWVRPFRSKHGRLIAQTVYGIFKNDAPSKLQSDNGKEFDNCALKAIADELKAEFIHPPPYQPWNDGQVERAVRTFKGALKRHIYFHGKENWWVPLKHFEESYNKTPHRAHGFVPFALEFDDYTGQELRNPEASDRIQRAIEFFRKPPLPMDKRVEIAQRNLVKYTQKMVDYFNKKATKNINIHPGDIVKLCDFTETGKRTRRGVGKRGSFKFKGKVVSVNRIQETTYCNIQWIEQGPRKKDVPGSITKRIHVSFIKKILVTNPRPSQGEIEIQEAREEEQPFIQYISNNEIQNSERTQSNPIETNEQTNEETPSVIPNEGQRLNDQELNTIASSLFLMMATHLERIRNEPRQIAASPTSLLSEVFKMSANELIEESRNQSTHRP
jgi:transposase InsO family protein